MISDDSNQFDLTLLDKLLSNIAILSVVDYKPPEEFITHVKTTQKIEDEAYADASEQSNSDSPALIENSDNSNSAIVSADQPTTPVGPPSLVVLPTSSGQGLQISAHLVWRDEQDNNNSAIVSADQTATPANLHLPIALPTSSGQGLQISAQLVWRDGQVVQDTTSEPIYLPPLSAFHLAALMKADG
ncbi:hypothetical protein FXO38_19134 [Capsicum annuum]|nr:hypothetical protein FXO38_19134 [Capsicum annuum]KAF3677667.1 hypothetical protein FXO37_04726 [Capsicum annuum]